MREALTRSTDSTVEEGVHLQINTEYMTNSTSCNLARSDTRTLGPSDRITREFENTYFVRYASRTVAGVNGADGGGSGLSLARESRKTTELAFQRFSAAAFFFSDRIPHLTDRRTDRPHPNLVVMLLVTLRYRTTALIGRSPARARSLLR